MVDNFKYKTLNDIKETKRYQKLNDKWSKSRSTYDLLVLLSYIWDECYSCEEFMEKFEKDIKAYINTFVDVKDIALGDKNVFYME